MAGPGVNLATAFVPVVPSMRGLSGQLTRQLSSAAGPAAAAAGVTSGRSWSAKFGTALKIGAGVAAGGAAALVGSALVKGFKRLSAIETATAKLKGLGNSAGDVKIIMDGALEAVQGTAFGMDEAATAAAGAVAAGIKPGAELNDVLKSMANSAAAAGVDMNEMGSIYNKVASVGKAQNDSLRQVAERGIPIYKALAEQFGVTEDAVFKMASKGQIDFAAFQQAMKTASGTVADEMGQTTLGSFENLNAAMSRLGAGLLAGVFPKIQPLLASLINVVDGLTLAAGPAAEAIGNALAPALDGITEWLDGLDFTSWSNFTASLAGGGASSSLASIWDSVKKLAPAFGELAVSLAASGPAFASMASAGIDILAGAMSWLAEHMDTIVKWMPAIVAGFVLWRAAAQGLASAQLAVRAGEVAMAPVYLANQALRWVNIRAEQQLAAAKIAGTGATVAQTGAENVGLATKVRTVATTVAQRVATVATTVATRAAAAGQWLLNAAMSANPIGLIIAGIAALVAGLVWFFTQTKVGQAIITAVWTGIKIAIGAVVTWFTTSVVPWFKTAIDAIVLGFQAFMVGATYAWNAVRAGISVVWNWINTYVFGPIATIVGTVIPAAFNAMKTLVNIHIAAWRAGINAAWTFVRNIIFTPLKTLVTVTIPGAFMMFKNLIQARMENFRAAILTKYAWVRQNVFAPLQTLVTVTIPGAFSAFKNAIWSRMEAFRSAIHEKYVWVRQNAFNPLRDLITKTVPNAFKTGVNLIGEFWNKLKKTASTPVKFVVDTVYNNGLVSMWNPIADFIGKGDWKLKKVDVSKFRAGGKVWGPGTETSDSIPARLSRNEHVLTAKDVRNLGGHGAVYALRKAAAKGWTPGLKGGGTLSDAARWLQSKGARITEFGAWGQRVGKHAPNSYHYSGRAFDANYGPGGENATEKRFFDGIIGEFHKLFPGLRTIWRAPGHFNHFHADTGKGGNVGSGGPGGGGGGGGGGFVPGLDKFVSWAKDKLKGVGKGRIAESLSAMTGKLIDGMAEKVQDTFGVFGGGGGGGGASGASQDVVAAVRGVAESFGWGSGAQWNAIDWLVQKESSWNPNAANPTSSARGLFQKMTSIHGPVEKTAEGQARWGLNYIKGRYKTPVAAMNWHKGHNWYAAGGAVNPTLSMLSGRMGLKPTLFDGGGWLTDRMVAVHGKKQPDAVLSSQQWSDVHKLAVESGGPGGQTVNLTVNFTGDIDSRATAEKVVDDLAFEVRRVFGGGRYV